MVPPDIDPLPPRQAWEEPPLGGWISHLTEVVLEVLAVLGAIAAPLAVWRLLAQARRLGAFATSDGWIRTLTVLLWSASALVAAALILFVWRRLGGFAMVGAMLTDHGRVARFGGRPPIWLDEAPPAALRVAHLSDLHVTEGDRVRLVEHPRPGGNRSLAALLERPELRQADAILITGDVTDRGTADSWQRFHELVAGAGLAERVVLVPGNHDLSLIDPLGNWRDPAGHWRRNDRFGIVQLANLLKFCEAFAATGGGRLGAVLGKDGPIPYLEAWAACEREVRPVVTALPALAVPRRPWGRGFFAGARQVRSYERRIEAARDALLALFPVAVPAGRDGVVFVLNSCTPVARHPATNALGRVGRAQYHRLDRLAGHFPHPIKLLALHHHVVRRAEEQSHDLFDRIVAKFTVLGDAPPLVRFCRKHQVRAVLNGHRHLSYQLRLPNGTVLIAAPSSTIGDELAHDPRPQFDRYDVAASADHFTVGIHRQVVRLPAAPRA
jgi:plasmid stabilization system protein ParE